MEHAWGLSVLGISPFLHGILHLGGRSYRSCSGFMSWIRSSSVLKRIEAACAPGMGQLQAKELKHEHVKEIIDRVFDHLSGYSGDDSITFQELYTAILLVYNDINKYFPGPHYDPPAREEVQELLKAYDTNLNGLLDRKEFSDFVENFTSHLASRVSRNILIFSIAAPCLALLTKSATERVPGVGPVVKRIPTAIYASLITTAVAVVGKVNDSS